MLIRIGGETQSAMDFLGLKQYPFSSKDISKCFRLAAKVHHPDYGGTNENMRKVLMFYKKIKHLAIDSIDKGVEVFEELENTDIFDLFDNQKCPQCNGNKTILKYYEVWKETCPKCDGKGIVELKCKYCNDGKFTLRSGRIIECRSCKGTGKFTPRCNVCHGSGFTGQYNRHSMNFYTTKTREETCPNCKGKGFIRVKVNPFNPVIPKGAVL